VYYFLETGYSQDWADFGPGIVLMHLFFEDLFRHEKPELLDFIAGDQPYKRSFSNSQHGAAYVYVASPGRWRFVLQTQQLLHILSRYVNRMLVVFRLDGAVRKLMGANH